MTMDVGGNVFVLSCAAGESSTVRVWSAHDGTLLHQLSHVPTAG